ncbi:hypothetical protein SprV_0802610100 [Sparganum proliferum]
MGTDCSEELDACVVGSEVYDVTHRAPEDGTYAMDLAKPRIPPGFEACGTAVNSENLCIPQLGTSSYYCRCAEGYAMDASLSYDNCLSATSPCASQICIEGSCVASKEGSVTKAEGKEARTATACTAREDGRPTQISLIFSCRRDKDGQKWICDCDDGYTGKYCDQMVGEWSAWSTWTLCDPYCGPRRQRKRLRVCLSEHQTDCTGAIENLEFCEPGEPCPAASTVEWAEWQDFVEWTWTVTYHSLVYIGASVMIFTVLIYLKPEFDETPEVGQQTAAGVTGPGPTSDIHITDLVRRQPGTSVPTLVMSPVEHANALPGPPSPANPDVSNSASPELRSLRMEDSYPLK